MHKVVNETKISFYDDCNKEIMYIDYSTDECIWYFSDSNEITITNDMELFESIKEIMLQQYVFNEDEILKSYKANNKLVWYSDCYFNPDDEWSRNSVSYITIEYIDGVFKLKCTKPLDNMGSEELADNIFRIAQTDAKLKRYKVDNEYTANSVHYEVGKEVRNSIKRLGGTMPEDLPKPDKSLKELEKDNKNKQLSTKSID